MDFFMDNILYISIFFIVFLCVFYFYKNQNKKVDIHEKNNQLFIDDIQLRLRAYERLVIFLDRIEPVRMINRLKLHTSQSDNLESLLVQNIITEYEYNISQQIYVSDELWKMIDLAKNEIINSIVDISSSLHKNASADDFVKMMISKYAKKNNLLIKKVQQSLKIEVRQSS